MNLLRVTLYELMAIKDAKIPDHEKLPKDCIYYKHFLQVQMNSKIEKVAKSQIK